MKITWTRPIDPVKIRYRDVFVGILFILGVFCLPVVVLWIMWTSLTPVLFLLAVGLVTMTVGLLESA